MQVLHGFPFPMNPLLSFRQEFGLSQIEMANLLGVRRAFVAQVETGYRNLPLRLLPLFRCLRDLAEEIQNQEPDLSEPLPDPKAARKLGREIKALENELEELRFQLRELEPKIVRCKRRLLLAQRIQQSPGLLPGSPLLALTLGAMEDKALVELHEKGPRLQQWLKLQARHLEEKIVFLKEMQAETESGYLQK